MAKCLQLPVRLALLEHQDAADKKIKAQLQDRIADSPHCKARQRFGKADRRRDGLIMFAPALIPDVERGMQLLRARVAAQ